MDEVVRQELYCHACRRYVQFDLDLSLNGNHVVTCPRCGHEHCRVVEDGRITDLRWGRRNGPTIPAANTSSTAASTMNHSSGTSNVTWSAYSSSTSGSGWATGNTY